MLKPKSISEIGVGQTITIVGGKYRNVTTVVTKVGTTYVTFTHPVTKDSNRAHWSFCRVHHVAAPNNVNLGTNNLNKSTSARQQVDVLIDLLMEKLAECTVEDRAVAMQTLQSKLTRFTPRV